MSAPSAWDDAVLAAALMAVDPPGLGGMTLRVSAGPLREHFLALWRDFLPLGTPVRRLPANIDDSRLLGGLDLSATLAAGRPVAERGLLAQCDHGVALVAMAERLSASLAAKLASVLDNGEIRVERDGLQHTTPASLGIVALDEGAGEDELPPMALLDRLAFRVDFSNLSHRDIGVAAFAASDIAVARERLPGVIISAEIIAALCESALALGIPSLRAALLAARAAQVSAAFAGRGAVAQEDAVIAGRLVLAPRATLLPAPDAQPEEAPPPDNPPPQDETESENDKETPDRALEDLVIEAALAAIPAGLLAKLQLAGQTTCAGAGGKAGTLQNKGLRGRPAGLLRAAPRAGQRLNLIETLRAAAPWQRLREREAAGRPSAVRLRLRADDFRVTRHKQRRETLTIFAVDASGSTALNRLAEAKGAVELLLADCYIRRDRVALIAFRGKAAELILPPTRSLPRAKRCLAGLPGGGGTPLAAGIEAAGFLADETRRKGVTPVVVLLTDGAANVGRDGKGGRAQAEADALAAARRLRALGCAALLIDSSPRPQPRAQALAAAMGARYLALPFAGAQMVSQAVRAAAQERAA